MIEDRRPPRPPEPPSSGNPFGRFEYVRVTFTAAGVPVAVPHTLRPADASQVLYMVVQCSAPAIIGQDTTATGRAARSSTLYLVSDTAPVEALILLATPNATLTTTLRQV